MNRLVLLTVTAAVAFGPTAVAAADPPRPLGGLDLNAYCISQGYERAVLLGGQVQGHNTFNNWRCLSGERAHPFSFARACKWQYGRQAVQAHPTDKNDAFSWVCYAVGKG